MTRLGDSRRAYPAAKLSRKRAAASLTMLLSGCRAERLAEFTAAELAATHNVPLQTAERMLAEARARR